VENARARSFNDCVVIGTMVIGSFLPGGLLSAFGWTTVLMLSLVPLLLAAAAFVAFSTQTARRGR
jgi:hypothetical protein